MTPTPGLPYEWDEDKREYTLRIRGVESGGAFGRVPDCAIFADTHWEPPSVYEHIEWLKDRLRIPLYVVDNGRSLREDVNALTNHSGSRRYIDIPVYLKGRDGQGDGIGRRQCTTNYKVRPIRTKIRELLGLRPRQRVLAGTSVELWLGIHRRGHTHEGLPGPVDDQPLPAHRGWHVPQGLRRVVGGSLRQAPGMFGIRRLPIPVPPKMGGDQAQAAGIVGRDGGDRCQDVGWAGATQDAVPAHAGNGWHRRSWEPRGRAGGFGNECKEHSGM